MSSIFSEEDRLRKIASLKKRIVGIYGSSLLTTPLNTETIHTIFKDDSEEEKARKNAENREILAARALELKQREPDLIQELEKIMERIKVARHDYGAIDNLYASSNAAMSQQQFVCEQCGNRDWNNIIQDSLRGDVVCNGIDNMGCGHVITDHTVDMGAEKRNFEGEEDRNHFGAAPNKLMPDVVNMETSLNIFVNGRENSSWKRLTQAQQNVEMNLSKLGKGDEKHTREGYKTQQKRKAFKLMEEIAGNINIHQLVVQKAKEEFTKYRDIRDALHQFEGVVSACLVLAYEELSQMMHLDEVTKSASITADIGGMEGDFGVLRPREELKDDPAISAVPECALAKFNLDQVHLWLTAVAAMAPATGDANSGTLAGNQEIARVLGEHVKKLVESNANGGSANGNGGGSSGVAHRRVSVLSSGNNIFGTTTVSNRLNRYKEGTSSSAPTSVGGGIGIKRGAATIGTNGTSVAAAGGDGGGHKTFTAGVHLLRTIQASSATSNLSVKVTSHFREALNRRTDYDIAKVEADRVAGLQAKRLKIEEAPGLISRKVNQYISVDDEPEAFDKNVTSSGTSKAPAPVVAPIEVVVSSDVKVAADFDLEDLVGGPVLVTPSLAASSNSSATSNHSSGANTAGIISRKSVGGVKPSVSDLVKVAVGPSIPAVSTHSSFASASTVGAGASLTAAAGAAVKVEDGAAAIKKVGMKPRPKIVIK